MPRKSLVIILATASLTVATALAQRQSDVREGIVRPFPVFWGVLDLTPKATLIAANKVQVELKITPEQTTELAELERKIAERFRQFWASERKSGRDFLSKESTDGSQVISKDRERAIEEKLTLSQRIRLDQIQLQSQATRAFERPEIQRRLELSPAQVAQLKNISESTSNVTDRALRFVVAVRPKDSGGALTLDDVRAYVKSPEFPKLYQRGIERVWGARVTMMDRVAAVLDDRQNAAYRTMLGDPFDVLSLRWKERDVEALTKSVALAVNLDGRRSADPKFDVKVARPAHGDNRPRVLMDEAHHNFLSVADRYRPFVQLITSDGYQVISNRSRFTKDSLKGCEILLIANPYAPETAESRNEAGPAFTDSESEVVRQWVEGGGSLLLIASDGPAGAAAPGMAGKFGVDMNIVETKDEANSLPARSTSLVFSRDDGLLADHSITRGRSGSERVARVLTFGGQSLKGPPAAVSLMKLASTAVDKLDHGNVSAAGRSQGLTFTFGKGRVVVLAAAQMLSAEVSRMGDYSLQTGMNQPGIDNRQFALNIVHWLSGLLEPRDADRKKSL
jgi:hypothetical protein